MASALLLLCPKTGSVAAAQRLWRPQCDRGPLTICWERGGGRGGRRVRSVATGGGCGMAVAGMLGEAVKGVATEVWSARGPARKLVVAVSLLVLIVREVLGLMKLVPYGVYAHCLYSSLAPFEAQAKAESKMRRRKSDERGRRWLRSLNDSVAVARNVCYGNAERNLLDVYVPERRAGVTEGPKPVIVFVHGGVWASGEKWQFSPLGAFLAEQGVVALLVQYTLYPEVLAIDQVREVSQALTWTMDNIGQYGGDPNRVFLMGHSSGAHLSAMVLWERARRRLQKAQHQPVAEDLDLRIPRGFLGLAGVYNIGEHYKYEVWRGVGAVSCMRPAMGGEPGFEPMSPSLLFESLLVESGVGFVKDGYVDPAADLVVQVKGADLVPPCVLFASPADAVVPPASSFAFDSMLQTLGCESHVVVHEALNHEDYVLWHKGWGNLKTHIGPFVEDVLNFVTRGTAAAGSRPPPPASAQVPASAPVY